jgi:hypothetical protein
MNSQWSHRLVTSTFVVAWALLGGTHAMRAQAPRIRYVSARTFNGVRGWEQRKDGSYDLWFSYLNRNLGEDRYVPVGRENSMDPGGADRGQPTYFYAGRRAFVFKVNVPKDFGKSELVWTLNVRGEFLEGRRFADAGVANQHAADRVAKRSKAPDSTPSIRIIRPRWLSIRSPPCHCPGGATLRAVVTDDGVPGPRPARPQRAGGTPPPFMNAPLPAGPARSTPGAVAGVDGVSRTSEGDLRPGGLLAGGRV